MTDDDKDGEVRKPAVSDRGRDRQDERERRLAERLRENLKKRKAQSRGRQAPKPANGGVSGNGGGRD
jgi:hypothetical protein